MGWDLYVIKPEHWQMHEDGTLSTSDMLKDEWYHSFEFDHWHQIWKSWRNGRLDDGYLEDDERNCEVIRTTPLPIALQDFYYQVSSPYSARNVADDFEQWIQQERIRSHSMEDFIKWLRFWADKGAFFDLSM